MTKMYVLVLYGCERLCVTLAEEHRLRVFEERVLLRETFGPNRRGETGGWGKTG